MRFTSTFSIAAVIALASAGSAMAADGFGTLEGVQAKALSATELASVRGGELVVDVPSAAIENSFLLGSLYPAKLGGNYDKDITPDMNAPVTSPPPQFQG